MGLAGVAGTFEDDYDNIDDDYVEADDNGGKDNDGNELCSWNL